MLSVYNYDPADSVTAGTLPELGVDTTYYTRYSNTTRLMHGVNVVLMSCVLSGRGTHYLGEHAYPEDGSSLSLVTYGVVHDIVTETPMEIMNLFLDPVGTPLPSVPPATQSTLVQLFPIHPELANDTNRAVRIPFGRNASVRHLLRLLHEELHGKASGFKLASRNLLSVLLTHVCRLAEENGVIRAQADVRMEQVRARLDAEFRRPLALDELAKVAGMSKTYLCRRFRGYAGQTVFGYLLDRRLEAAMHALRATDATVSAISFESGFSDIGFFNRKFKSRFGVTPGEYRRRDREQ